jgi:methionyl-tRNA formyltransferase
MKIIIITQGISEILDPILRSNHEVIGIIESAPRNELPKIKRLIKRAISKVHILFNLKIISLSDFAKKNNIPYYYFKKGDDKGAEEWIRMKSPDLIVVYSMSQLLKESILRIPKNGIINLHLSYLPNYRGPSPLFWMYHDFILDPGITVSYIEKNEDTGDIIYQKKIKINVGDSLSTYKEKIHPHIVELILKSIEDISNGDAPRLKQPKESPTPRARNIYLEEYVKLIDWNEWDVERVFHFLKGTQKHHNQLINKNNIYKLGAKIEILNFDRCTVSKSKIGKIERENRIHCLICKNGKIYMDISFNLVTLLKHIVA